MIRFQKLRIGLAVIVLASPAFAQPRQLSFEVASVKPSGPSSRRNFTGGPGSRNPTRYTANQASFLDLIAAAYNVESFQITGKIPLDKEHFDVAANIPEGASKEEFRLMLRQLLAERFHLKAHVELKDYPAYELIIAKSGLKLKEPAPGSTPAQLPAGFPQIPNDGPGMISMNSREGSYILVRMTARQQPISVLAELGSSWTPDGEPVVDRTGLTGKYDFFLEHTLDPSAATPNTAASAPGIFTALQQQLGLELVAKKLPFDHVIVDEVDTVPSDN